MLSRILLEAGDWRPSISGIPFSTLDNIEVELLEAAFYEEEIQTALFSSSGDKVLGLDEFT